MIAISIATALILLTGSVISRPFNSTTTFRGCATYKSDQAISIAEASFQADLLSVNANVDFSAAAAASIPVVWHIISKNEDVTGGNIPDSQVSSSIDAMNEHYASTGISFVLEKTTRTTNSEWFSKVGPDTPTEMDMKESLWEGDASTLNVYSVGFETGDGEGLLGYATFPSDFVGAPKNDGVVLLYSAVPGGSTTGFNEGKILTHEVGHWLGLYHPFQGGCSGVGDMVDDTPASAGPISCVNAPDGTDTCRSAGADPIHNFMGYGPDACLHEFTPGQAARAKQQALTYRGLTF